jgi:hypothetical protein
MRAIPAPLLAVALLAAACGGRTQLLVQLDAGTPAPDAMDRVSPAVQPGSPCHGDADCATDHYCVAAAHCDPVAGCVLAARSCDDGIDCTRDDCSDVAKRCSHTPDDTRCPDTELCSARRGCDAFVYAVASDGHLYEARIPSGQLVDLGTPAASLGDVALDSSGILYATDSYILYRIDRATSASTTIASILPLHLYNGLGIASDESLVATADVPQLFKIDSLYGSSLAVAQLPPESGESGDVTRLGSRTLVATASIAHPATDNLVEVDLSTQRSSIIGDLRYPCVWGLATLGGIVYGFTCQRLILKVDATSGTATEIARAAPAFLGAAGR